MTIFKSDLPPIDIDERPMATQILEAIRNHSHNDATKKAFINGTDEDNYITYSQLYTQIHAFAAFLVEIGFSHDDVLCLVLKNRKEYPIVLVGTWAAGGVVSGASYAFTAWELARQFNDSGASVVVCEDSSLDRVRSAIKESPKVKSIIIIGQTVTVQNVNVYNMGDILNKKSLPLLPQIKFRVEKDLCLIPYSSGTTGVPKGVMITHRNLSAMMTMFRSQLTYLYEAIAEGYDPKKETTVVFLPFYHVYGNSLLTNAMFTGGTTVFMSSFDPHVFCSSIQKYNIKTISVVPPIAVFLAKSPTVDKYDLSSVKYIACGAAPLGQDLANEVKKRLPNVQGIHQGYGMTEMTMASHRMNPMLAVGDRMSSIGTLLPNTEAIIRDVETGKTLGVNQKGEICVRSPSVMLGYLNKAEETAKTIDKDGWLHTGDIGYADKDGFFFIVDRLKELIKVRGFQVPPAELEDLLLSHPQIADAAVIGIKDQRSGELPKAFIVRKTASLTAEEVKKFVADKTAQYKHLKGGVEFVNQIPRSPAGKILRKTLREASVPPSRL